MNRQIMIKKTLILIFLVLFAGNLNAFANTYKMVFVPASEKGDESDYESLIEIIARNANVKIKSIKVIDYNAAVEAMRADRAQLAWFGGKTYIKAAEIANNAYKNGTTLKEEALKLKYLSEEEFDKWVDPNKMTGE